MLATYSSDFGDYVLLSINFGDNNLTRAALAVSDVSTWYSRASQSFGPGDSKTTVNGRSLVRLVPREMWYRLVQ